MNLTIVQESLQVPNPMPVQSIPVVSLQNFTHGSARDQEHFVQVMGSALEAIGFFALVDHSVDPALIKAAYQATADFFTLPQAIKQSYEDLSLKGQRGFTRFGREHAKDHPDPDLKEFWHVGRELSPDHALGLNYPPNLWPYETPEFQPLMIELYRQLETCANVLLEACALYLGHPRHSLREMVREADTILRIIHYPPMSPEFSPTSLRAAAHEDINFITLLCEATAPGLEILQRDGDWRPIQALPGQIIVDTGDMLQNLTNGLLKSTTHRVTNPDNDRDRRFSMPFFVHPRAEVDLTPLPDCVTKTGGKTSYPSLTAGEYLHQRLCEIGLA